MTERYPRNPKRFLAPRGTRTRHHRAFCHTHCFPVRGVSAQVVKPRDRLFEQNGTSSLLWYTVLAVTRNELLSLAGYCTPEWGGPCSTLLTLKLAEHGKGTRLTVSDALYGRVEDKQVESLRSGWQQMFNDGLRKFVEAA